MPKEKVKTDQDKIEEFLANWKNRVTSGKLYNIEDKRGKKVPFIPNRYQENLYDNLHNYNVIPKARQIGFSTAIDILGLDFAIFNENMNVGVIADTLDNAQKLFQSKIKFPYDNLGGFDEGSAQYAVGQEIKKNVYIVKNNESTLKFSNGSSIYVSTSFRSGTLQFLHISEFGKIAAKYPEKATEILTGAVEAVGEGGIIFIESTAEGKNDFYVIVKRGKKLELMGKKLNHLEPKLFFVAWWQNPDYVMHDEETVLTSDTITYFKGLKKEHGITVNEAQAKWWQLKKENLRDKMGREYPSYLDEAFEVISQGAYLKKQIERLLKEQRFTSLPHTPGYPVYMVGDLGMRDAKDMVFFQLIGKEIRLLKWWRGSDTSFKDYIASVVQKLPYEVDRIFIPHDGVKRNENDGTSVEDMSIDMGYDTEVLGIASVQGGIELIRDLFSRIWMNKVECYQPVKVGGEFTSLSLVDMLSAYQEEFDKVHGIGLGRPKHNDASHTGDMIRYLGQAVTLIEEEGEVKIQEVQGYDNDDFF